MNANYYQIGLGGHCYTSHKTPVALMVKNSLLEVQQQKTSKSYRDKQELKKPAS